MAEEKFDLKARILAAAAKRVRGGFVTVGGERFAVDFRVYPARELGEITNKIIKADNSEGAAILAEQILDPATKQPLFTGKEIEAMANADMVALLKAWSNFNLGDPEKN